MMMAGMAAGLAGAAEKVSRVPDDIMRREEAKTMQQQRQLQLQHAQQMLPLQRTQTELQVEQMQNAIGTMRRESLLNHTYQGFTAYNTDGDVRHLNNVLEYARNTPEGNMTWGRWARFEPLTRDRETEAALGQAGYTNLDEVFDNPELQRSFVIGIGVDGEKTVLDMDQLEVVTGYTDIADQKQLERLQRQAELKNLLRGQQSAETNVILRMYEENPEAGYSAAVERYYEIKNAGRTEGSSVERVAAQLRRDNPELGYEESLRQAVLATEQRTSHIKDTEAAMGVREQIDQIAGGDFFAPGKISDPAIRRQVGPLITNLERLTGTSLSTEDKRTARNLRSLIELGNTAGSQITDAETGILDSMLRSVKGYFSDDIGGTEGRAAYEAFRNVFRNALYGATLTDTEIKAFESAMGNLKLQTGPVLQRLQVQMQDIQQQLKSIYDMNDEHVAHYYLGSSLERIDDVMGALDERLAYYGSHAEPSIVRVPSARQPQGQQQQQTPPAERRPLNEYFK